MTSVSTNSAYKPLPWVSKLAISIQGSLSVPKRVHHKQKALTVGKQGRSSTSQGLTNLGWLRGLGGPLFVEGRVTVLN